MSKNTEYTWALTICGFLYLPAILVGLLASLRVGSAAFHESIFTGILYLIVGWELVAGLVAICCVGIVAIPIHFVEAIYRSIWKQHHRVSATESLNTRRDESNDKAA